MSAGVHNLNRKVSFDNSATSDAFGRGRVSEPFGIFEHKNIFNKGDSLFEERTNGAGASITHLSAESAVQLTVGTVSGEFAIRQTVRYFAYVPGKSHLAILTGVLGAGKAGVVQRIGYFDNNDGLFFEQTETGPNVVVRSNVTGTPVDTAVPQASWNLDKLDGSGPSGKIVDFTKSQIFVIDLQWLGVGRVRFGLDIDGELIYVHEQNHANSTTQVYMASPTLPIRYEIRNVGASASSTSLKEICCSVASEGGYILPGFEFSAGNGITTRAVTTRAPILAIRLTSTLNGKPNRRTVRSLNADMYVTTNDAYFEIVHVHNPSAITATWSQPATITGSAVEVSTDITAVTGSPSHLIEPSYVTTAAGNKGLGLVVPLDSINNHGFISQNFESNNSQMFVIYATSFAGTADVSAAITWIEFD